MINCADLAWMAARSGGCPCRGKCWGHRWSTPKDPSSSASARIRETNRRAGSCSALTVQGTTSSGNTAPQLRSSRRRHWAMTGSFISATTTAIYMPLIRTAVCNGPNYWAHPSVRPRRSLAPNNWRWVWRTGHWLFCGALRARFATAAGQSFWERRSRAAFHRRDLAAMFAHPATSNRLKTKIGPLRRGLVNFFGPLFH